MATTTIVSKPDHPLAPALASVSNLLRTWVNGGDQDGHPDVTDALTRALIDLIRGVRNVDGLCLWVDDNAGIAPGVLEVSTDGDGYFLIDTDDGEVCFVEGE